MSAGIQRTRNRTAGPRLVQPPPPKTTREIPWKKIGIYAAVAISCFTLGIVPMWLKARQYAEELQTTQQEFRLKQMENVLAAAVISADRGDYEPARQMASDFFNAVRSQVERGQGSDLSNAQIAKVRFLLDNRDDIITLLARSDPAAADRLSDMYVAYRRAVNDVSVPDRASTSAGSE